MPLGNEGINTKIFRITHIDNLQLIIDNGLVCPNSQNANVNFRHIGYQQLIAQRGSTEVPVDPRGVLNDYVPFYFAPKSPMLYSINLGNTEYHGPQHKILYLVSNIGLINNAHRPFVFTDAHAHAFISNFYNNIANLVAIDWQLMNAVYWNNTENDPTRMQRRMAEFLVYQFVPVSCILEIVAMNPLVKREVEEILNRNQMNIPVNVNQYWYF